MKRSRLTVSALTRLVSVGMLLLWLTAVAHCTADCCSDDARSTPTSGDTAAKATTVPSHSTNQAGHHDHGFCDSLHSVCPIFPSAAVVRPDFGLADNLNLVSSGPTTTLPSLETLIRRQPPDCRWAFMPEVCLGPALQSHAPPVSSLS